MASPQYQSIHGAYDKSTGHKVAVVIGTRGVKTVSNANFPKDLRLFQGSRRSEGTLRAPLALATEDACAGSVARKFHHRRNVALISYIRGVCPA